MQPPRPGQSQHCVFGDICDLMVPAVAILKEQAGRMSPDDLIKVFRTGKAVCNKAKCLVHTVGTGLCACAVATLHIAGTPCPAYSSQRRGVIDVAGRIDFLAFLTWAAHRRLLQEAWIIHENVKKFSMQLMELLLGDMYIIQSVVLDVHSLGFPAERIRRFTILRHKRTVIVSPEGPEGRHPVFDCLQTFFDLFKRPSEAHWGIYFVAGDDELQAEIDYASRRPTSRWHVEGLENISDFEKALNHMEHNFLDGYKQICPDGVAALEQNPFENKTCNTGKDSLMTLTAQGGVLWSMQHNRWLTPLEALQVMNFPVYDSPSNFGAGCSFRLRREDFGFPPRALRTMRSQAGNSFNLAIVGICIFYCLQCQVAVSKMQAAKVGPQGPLCRASRRRLHSQLSSAAAESSAESPAVPSRAPGGLLAIAHEVASRRLRGERSDP